MALRTSLVAQPHLYMGDSTGKPLDYGMVYFGQPNKDPEYYPIDIYYDEALTIAASQPVRTKGGFLNANGDMTEVYAAEIEYSVKVLDSYGRQVFYQENMSSASTSASVSTSLPYVGSVVRTLPEKNYDTVSILDFGAKGDGVTDDANAFSIGSFYCYESGKDLYVPATENGYYIGSSVAMSPCLVVSDDNTLYKINNIASQVCFDFTSTSKFEQLVGFVGGIFEAQNPFAGTLFKTPRNSDLYFIQKVRYAFDKIVVTGKTRKTDGYSYCYNESFAEHIVLGDTVDATIDGFFASGDYDIKQPNTSNNKTVSITLDATSGILMCRITRPIISTVHTPVLVKSRAFYEVSSFDFIGTFDGIIEEDTTATLFSEPRIFNGNLNVQRTGIAIRKNQTRNFKDITIRRHRSGNKTDTHNWIGIDCKDNSFLKFDNCLMQPDTSDGAFLGTSYAFSFKNCSVIKFDGNTIGTNIDKGFLFDNCNQIVGSNTNTSQNRSTDSVFHLINSSKNAALGNVIKVSTFSGSTLTTDATATDYSVADSASTTQANQLTLVSTKKIKTFSFVDAYGDKTIRKAVLNSSGGTVNYELFDFTEDAITGYENRAATFKINDLSAKNIAPPTDAIYNIGSASLSYDNIYLKNSPIVASDERLKQDFRSLKAAEKAAAIEIKDSIFLYKMQASVAEKGDGARWHVGVKAQQIVSIMESHKLKPFDYGFICYDEWGTQDAVVDEDSNEVQAAREASDKYAVRYDELSMFILAAI